jgi:DNA-binding ferritin-like protein
MYKVVMQDEESALAEKYTAMGASAQGALETFLAQTHAMIEEKSIEGETAQAIKTLAARIGETLGKELEELLADMAEATQTFVQDIAEDETYDL